MGISLSLAEYLDPVKHRIFIQTGVPNPWLKIDPTMAKVAEYSRKGPKWTEGGEEGLAYMSEDQITILRALTAISQAVKTKGKAGLLERVRAVKAQMKGKTASGLVDIAAKVPKLAAKPMKYAKSVGVSRARELIA